MDEGKRLAIEALSARAAAGRPLRLWWRDDDAVAPSAPLDRLLDLVAGHRLPLTLAVIPAPEGAAPSGPALAERLAGEAGVRVAPHGYSHANHAGSDEKKCELCPARPAQSVLEELARGHAQLRALHHERCLALLVPPWNRIAPAVRAGLGAAGFKALSTFGAPKGPEAQINTHLDIMDWHGTRSLRAPNTLWRELAALARADLPFAGLLTHHLVHDAACWAFLEEFAALTTKAGAHWVGAERLLVELEG
ncbi:polysaccharide deacetylase family protein [Rhodobacter maris]|uniref:Polysaccharide deacetylase n=1 Tax=Rhodobacter maris TaxID=446682 RepID=A0A285TAP2_9RHOB|nr:polysaccharide deacetylase family protein [Rhodobacter maris]SOC18312.1 hypothetical protein SAMN05877831_11642 [Rhodobacter maris]